MVAMKLFKQHPGRSCERTRAGPFRRNDRGVAAIEFALILPILALLLLGCFEVPKLVLLYQKIARTSSGVADLVAQADNPLTTNQMTDIFIAAQNMMQPYDLLTNGEVIVSSVNNPDNNGVIITWQVTMGADTTPSKLGAANTSNPPLPSGIGPASNEEVIATEVYYNYTPIFKSYIYSGSKLYLNAYTRPRNHNLTTSPCPTAAPPAPNSCTITVPAL
jgi:Flp pilus assembly protein TadG